MLKTTAKVEHRDRVPYGWIAIEFCDVDFYGFRAEEMKKKWRDIEHKRYVEYNTLYEENKAKIQAMENSADAIREVVKESKPFYRFWYNKDEKEMLSKADELLDQADELKKENKKVKKKRFFETYECLRKIEELLQENGFVLTHTASRGEECIVKTEVWTLEE